MKIDYKIVKHDARDTETLIKVGLHISTIMCADHSNNPEVPKNLSNYTDHEMRMNNAYRKAYSRRMLRQSTVLKPARHTVAWIDKITNDGVNI